MKSMFIYWFVVNNNIIKENWKKFLKKRLKCMVYEVLECSWGIDKFKGYN